MTEDAQTAQQKTPADFDPNLLDRMIGELGDRLSIETRGLAIQNAIINPFQEAFHRATGLEIELKAGEIHRGRRRELLEKLSNDAAFCEAGIRGWSQELVHLCGTSLVIALVECLLGGSDPDNLDVTGRPLSDIELDMSLLVFEQLNESLMTLVTSDPKARASVSKPRSILPDPENDPVRDFHAVALVLDLEFGAVTAPLIILLAQSVLLKTKLIAAKPEAKGAPQDLSDWTERLSKKVVRSQVGLQARVALEPMRLGDIGRLQAGDLLAFADTGKTEVTLGANGKDLYTCSLGRSGQRYMIRVEKPAGPDEDWKDDFA